MSQKKDGGVIVPKSDTFTEKFVTNFIISHTPDDYFILDFGRPVFDTYADEESGKVLGHRGEVQLEVRLYMTPKNTKEMLDALRSNIERYEEKKK